MAADNPIDPIHQFEISKIAEMQIAGIDISFTNSSLFMVFAIAATMTLFILGLSKRSIIPNRMQMLSELSYNFIANMLRDQVGDQGRAYFPFIFSLFMFIFFCNFLPSSSLRACEIINLLASETFGLLIFSRGCELPFFNGTL